MPKQYHCGGKVYLIKLADYNRTGARCLQQKSWQKYDKSVPDAFRPLVWSVQGLNQLIYCVYLHIYKDEWKTAVSSSESELTENIPVENLCFIPVWHHNGSHAIYGSGHGTTIHLIKYKKRTCILVSLLPLGISSTFRDLF